MTITPRDRALFGAVIAIAILAAFVVLGILPEHRRANRLGGEIAAARTQLVSAQAAYATGRAAQAHLLTLAPQFHAAGQAVPENADIPALLRLLQHTAASADVDIESITPGSASTAASADATAATSTPTSTAGATAASVTAAAPVSIPISLTFGGGYVALNRLVRRLNTLVGVSSGRLIARGPLVGISNVQLAQGAANGSLSVSLTATIYQTDGTPSVTTQGAS